MAMRFHVPGYEIELQPAGAILLALFIAIAAVSIKLWCVSCSAAGNPDRECNRADGVLAPMGRSTLDHRGQQTTPAGGSGRGAVY